MELLLENAARPSMRSLAEGYARGLEGDPFIETRSALATTRRSWVAPGSGQICLIGYYTYPIG